MKDTLTDIKDVLEDLELKAATLVEQTEAPVTFAEGRTYAFGGRTYPVPDGFSAAEDGGELVLFLPNPENPDEAEASATILRVRHDGIMTIAEAELPGHDAVTEEKERAIVTAYYAYEHEFRNRG
ncbi:MAG: hypothetical protein J6Z23_08160 [Lachnospiraceae bacterium]|nr:hypothetical protein [Lachnospiraceae bacterium]MBP5255335.1 hypothetical protein [Lachnospiraceae bacterium]